MKAATRIGSSLIISCFAASGVVAQQATMTSDQVRIAVQQICPVSGLELGVHGPPVKAQIGEEQVFLCCQACLQGDVKTEHWTTIHTNFAKAQGVCVVMENKLPKQPQWAIVGGRVFYVCCPPCSDELRAEPKKFTKKLDALYQASVKARGPS